VRDRPAPSATTVLDCPFGPLHVAVTSSAVVALELRSDDTAFAHAVARRTGRLPAPVGEADVLTRRWLDSVAQALDAYWAGDPTALDLPVDLVGLSSWDRRVLEAVRRVPFGRVTSYGRLALAIGARGAARAAGGAVGRNPIGLVIPCHRVIAGDGSIGGYGGARTGTHDEQVELKRALLLGEGILLPARELVVPVG
jgi:methylated-DNA-[protein]-cysteine S-methyltransferase